MEIAAHALGLDPEVTSLLTMTGKSPDRPEPGSAPLLPPPCGWWTMHASGAGTMEPDIAELRRMIDEAQRIVFFTGAGISTESGIPDFRSPGGIWTRMKPIDFSEFLASDEARRETWRRRFATDATMRKAQPNRGHRAVATLVNRGKASAVITQNIDGLHQGSGVPASRVIELHGNTTYAHCLDCAHRYEIEDIRIEFERTGEPPCCVSCGGYVKTATVSFGQS